MTPRVSAVVALVLGALAIVVATVAGQERGWLDTLVTPPTPIRAVLLGFAAALGVILLLRSLARLAEADPDDVPGLVRAVRLAFLAVAAWAAAAGWAIGHPLPLVVAAVIAGIDVVETSFLLIVVGGRRGR